MPLGPCEHFITPEELGSDDPWAGTFCKLTAGHAGQHSAHYPKGVPTPAQAAPTPPPLPERLTRADLNAALHNLEDQKRNGLPGGAAVLEHIAGLRADLARIPVRRQVEARHASLDGPPLEGGSTMSITPRTFYVAACDGCSEPVREWEYDTEALWWSPVEALRNASEMEGEHGAWRVLGTLIVCDECLRRFREHLGALDDDHNGAGWRWDAVYHMGSSVGDRADAGRWAEARLRAWLWTPGSRELATEASP